MTDEHQKTAVERPDRYSAERRRTLEANGGKTVIIDEAGGIAWGRPEDCRSSKVDLMRARQADVEVRNVRLAPGQKIDIETVADGDFVLADVWFTR